jgi:hypothetical protein
MEVAQLASEAGFIFGVSGVMVAMTLIVSGGGSGWHMRHSCVAKFQLQQDDGDWGSHNISCCQRS